MSEELSNSFSGQTSNGGERGTSTGRVRRVYQYRRLPEPLYFLTSMPVLARHWLFHTTVGAPFAFTMLLVYLSVNQITGRATEANPQFLLMALPFVPGLLWSAYSSHMLLMHPLSHDRPRMINQIGVVIGVSCYAALSTLMVLHSPQWITISVFAALTVLVLSLATSGLQKIRGSRFNVQQAMVILTIISFGMVLVATPGRRMGMSNLVSLFFLAVVSCAPLVSLVNQLAMLRYIHAERVYRKVKHPEAWQAILSAILFWLLIVLPIGYVLLRLKFFELPFAVRLFLGQ